MPPSLIPRAAIPAAAATPVHPPVYTPVPTYGALDDSAPYAAAAAVGAAAADGVQRIVVEDPVTGRVMTFEEADYARHKYHEECEGADRNDKNKDLDVDRAWQGLPATFIKNLGPGDVLSAIPLLMQLWNWWDSKGPGDEPVHTLGSAAWEGLKSAVTRRDRTPEGPR